MPAIPEKYTNKAWVIQWLFDRRWNAETATLSNPVVSLSNVTEGMAAFNAQNPHLKAFKLNNAANFLKDFIRVTASANANWPKPIFDLGYTAAQSTGKGDCFEFIKVPQGLEAPFRQRLYPDPLAPHVELSMQSLSILPMAKRLGRNDETWVLQVAVQLNLVELHLAVASPQLGIDHVQHLQTGIKQSNSEIDALYVASTIGGDDSHASQYLITLEAKGDIDDILDTQVVSQVKAVKAMRAKQAKTALQLPSRVVPMAIKVVGPSRIFVAQYALIDLDNDKIPEELTIFSQSTITLRPPVPGIGSSKKTKSSPAT
jgi:hypothetical protein